MQIANRKSQIARVPASPRLETAYRLPPTAYRPRGFSFTEILFAIMILGIGFIMVAAMFPVAIQQTETSRQESVGAALARSGVGYVQQMANATFIQSKPAPTAPLPLVPLCALRPTIVFGSTVGYDDQNLYNAVYLNNPSLTSGNFLPPAWSLPPLAGGTAGTYVIQGEVWDFTPVLKAYFGSEFVSQVNGVKLGTPITLTSLLTSMESQNMVQTSDPRFAWIGFYKRDIIMTSPTATSPATFAFAPSAQVIIVATQVRTGQSYNMNVPPSGTTTPEQDVPFFSNNQQLDGATLYTPLPPPSLQASRSAMSGPSPAVITPPSSANLDASITFSDGIQSVRAAEGAFVIIAADPPGVPRGSTAHEKHGLLNGRIYRLGAQNATTGAWNFAPGYGPSASDLTVMASTPNPSFRFLVYVVGRGLNPDGATPPFAGPAQDIAVYSTFISCPNP